MLLGWLIPRAKHAIDLAALSQKIDQGEIKQLTLKQNEAIAIDSRNQEFRAQLTSDQIRNTLYNKSQEKNAEGLGKVGKFEDDSGSSSYIWPMLITWAPLLFIIGIWVFMLRQMQSGGNKALSFGKSRAKLLNNQQKRVTFKDVAGVEEAKEELQESSFSRSRRSSKNSADVFPKAC